MSYMFCYGGVLIEEEIELLKREVNDLRLTQEFIIRTLRMLNNCDDHIINTLVPLVNDFRMRRMVEESRSVSYVE